MDDEFMHSNSKTRENLANYFTLG